MKANEAQKLAQRNRASLLQSIYATIKYKAKLGHYMLAVKEMLTQAEVELLTKDGYEVICQNGLTYVSWRPYGSK